MNFLPRFCPSCGKELGIGKQYESLGEMLVREITGETLLKNDLTLQDWNAHCAFKCSCGLVFQFADTDDVVAAAAISGGDMDRY